MVIFRSYVSLPEGMFIEIQGGVVSLPIQNPSQSSGT